MPLPISCLCAFDWDGVERIFKLITGMCAVGALFYSARSYNQTAKIFGFQNRVIPKVKTSNDGSRITIENKGKSPIRDLKGTFRFIYKGSGDAKVVVPRSSDYVFEREELETDEEMEIDTNFKWDHLPSQQTGFLFFIISLKCLDLNKIYSKIYYLDLARSGGFAFKRTDRSLWDIPLEYKSLVKEHLDRVDGSLGAS